MALFPFRRKKPSDAVSGGNEVLDISYNRYAGALKMLPVAGMLTPIGSLISAVALPDLGTTVAIFNPTGGVLYVKFGDSTVTAPTGGADGIPVPPSQYITLAAGPYGYVISNGPMFGYLVGDDAYLAPITTT